MKNKYAVVILAGVLILGICLGFLLRGCPCKMAVVDFAAIVNKSVQVASLRDEQIIRNKELLQWLQTVQDEVKAVNDEKKKEELLQNYNEEFVRRKNEINNNYADKLQALDKDITQKIIDVAKRKGYKAVASKGLIIYGGDDITEEVIQELR